MKADAATVAVGTIAKCQEKRIYKRLRLDSLKIDFNRLPTERSQKTHDFYGTSEDDWMEAATNISAGNDLPMNTAHEIDDALWANLVHGTTRNDRINCLDDPDFQRNKLVFEHVSEL